MNPVALLPTNGDDEFLVQFALNRAWVSAEQVADARAAMRGLGGGGTYDRALSQGKGIGREATLLLALSHAGVLDLTGLARQLADEFGLAFLATLPREPVRSEVLARIPPGVARRYRVVPLDAGRSFLRFAIDNPLDPERLEAIRRVAGVELDPVISPADEIERAIELNYPVADEIVEEDAVPRVEVDKDLTTPAPSAPDTGFEQALSLSADEPIIHLVRKLIIDALQRRASDIHLEPTATAFRVRNRVDGLLREVAAPSRDLHPAIVSRVKILSRLSIAEKRRPQDGRLRFDGGSDPVDLRVSVIPTAHGESVVMRVLDDARARLGLAELGFDAQDRVVWERLTSRSAGMVLVTGPTGSGKTTTLYRALNALNTPIRKIVTVEDPVENQISGINQVAVHPEIGMTFARALRALLRQAPNVLMVGEIRDRETAELATNAGMTGHLVFSSLHTNDAWGAVTRLHDLGVKPFMVASALKGVLAQRLVRRICCRCRTPVVLSPSERRVIERRDPVNTLPDACAFRGAGCDHCEGSGYAGRIGLFELLVIDSGMHQALHRGSTVASLRSRWRCQGGRTLREDGLQKVRLGLTTLEEVFSSTPASDDDETNL